MPGKEAARLTCESSIELQLCIFMLNRLYNQANLNLGSKHLTQQVQEPKCIKSTHLHRCKNLKCIKSTHLLLGIISTILSWGGRGNFRDSDIKTSISSYNSREMDRNSINFDSCHPHERSYNGTTLKGS